MRDFARKLPALNALRAFEAAARYQSFASAAAELSITQSSISHHVRKLEDWLDRRLFEREGKGVRLTDEGERLRDVLEESLDAIEQEVARLASPRRTGTITVQTYSTFAVLWLIPRLARFRMRYPRVEVLLNTSSSDPDMFRDQVDLAIRYGTGQAESEDGDIHYDFLFGSSILPVCHSSLFAGCARPDLTDIHRWPLLEVHSAPEDWSQWLQAAGASEAEPARRIRFDSYLVVLEAALAGHGIAIARRPFVDRYLDNGGLIAPFELEVAASAAWYAVSRANLSATYGVRMFRAWLLEEATSERHSPTSVAVR